MDDRGEAIVEERKKEESKWEKKMKKESKTLKKVKKIESRQAKDCEGDGVQIWPWPFLKFI